MSSICQSFESNAWRSDLCSHCFQSREEHERLAKSDVGNKEASTSGLGSRYQSVLNHCRSSYKSIQTTPAAVPSSAARKDDDEVKSGILKSPGKTAPSSNKTGKCVNFPDEDDAHEQVIGYGGHECLESDTDDDDHDGADHRSSDADDDDDDSWPFTEEERVIQNQTQKNTSFNSVSRNLLAAEVATFKSHGVSSSSSSGNGTGGKSAPLVTIRPFGQEATPAAGSRSVPTMTMTKTTTMTTTTTTTVLNGSKSSQTDNPKVNLVTPMRNGQALKKEAPATDASNGAATGRENVKFNQAKMKGAPPEEAKRDDAEEEEKFTSFTDPTPMTTTVTATASAIPAGSEDVASKNKKNAEKDPKALVLQSSRVASGRIDEQNNNNNNNSSGAKNLCKNSTLSRKPPVWREKPRIPIKPQSVITIQQASVDENGSVGSNQSKPVVYAVPKTATATKKEDEKVETRESPVPLGGQTQSTDTVAATRDDHLEALVTDSGHGQVSIRFVASASAASAASVAAVSVDVKPQDKVPMLTDKERCALERLDQLDAPDQATDDQKEASEQRVDASDQYSTPPDSLEYAPVVDNKPPVTGDKAPALDDDAATGKDHFESRHNSTRGLTRSAFEALRANLAGSLELSRMVQQQQQQPKPAGSQQNGSAKRQAPPTPTREVEKSPADAASGKHNNSGEQQQEKQSVPPTPPPPPPGPLTQQQQQQQQRRPEPQPVLKVKRSAERALSASPRFRNSLVCTSPEGETVEDPRQPRSVSLTRVERCDSERQHAPNKPPSIRKIIKERATQLLSIADGSSSKTGSARLSRADRFVAEGAKKGAGKGRFSSIRKLLGLKKEQAPEELVEAISPKIRPEIVHPIDLHPLGQVEVVSAKPEHVITLSTSSAEPAGVHQTRNSQSESICSGDSGRNSSLDFQPSDSSLVSGSSGSDGGSSPAASLLSSSFKNTTPAGRPKPPPPPRSTYKDASAGSPGSKPARPPPPKSTELLHIQKASPSLLESRSNSSATEYANLGEVRRAMSPKKPERSASMRTKELRPVSAVNTNIDLLAVADNRLDGLHYDCVTIGQQQQQPASGPGLLKANADEDGYIIPLRMKPTPSFSSASSSSAGSSQRLSLTSFNPPATIYQQPQQQQQQPASLGASSDTSSSVPSSRRTLRPGGIRQSRMDLHVKLENHYGTVTGANFQALAQLLEQATSKRPLAAHFHELRRIKGLNWNAFGSSTEHDIVLLRTGTLTVLKSTWQTHDLLLSVYHHSLQDNVDNKAPFAQPSVVHFHDQVPAPFLSIPGNRAGVEVFPPGQVATLKQLPHVFSVELDGVERMQHCLSILLQVCRALEWLLQQQQQQHHHHQRTLGRLNHDEIVFYREHSQDAYRLLWMAQLQPDAELSVGGLSVRETLTGSIRCLAPLLSGALVDKISSVLQRDGHRPLAAVLDTLSRFLEFALFGPSTDLFDGDPDPIEMFQRWLDVERASALNELIRTQGLWRVKLNIIEEFRLSFLVTTTPQSLLDTSQI